MAGQIRSFNRAHGISSTTAGTPGTQNVRLLAKRLTRSYGITPFLHGLLSSFHLWTTPSVFPFTRGASHLYCRSDRSATSPGSRQPCPRPVHLSASDSAQHKSKPVRQITVGRMATVVHREKLTPLTREGSDRCQVGHARKNACNGRPRRCSASDIVFGT
jgi:hypothetical protein